MSQQSDFSGVWHSCYWYPSNDHDGEDTSEYEVNVHQEGNQLVLQSQPTESGAYILIRLTVDDGLATGTWHETTAPQGSFEGMIYSGAMQLLVSEDGNKMTGKWVGVGRDHQKDAADIYTGRWELTRSVIS